MFANCTSLVGGNKTVYDINNNGANEDIKYARIDTPETPGYFTKKSAVSETDVKLSGDANCDKTVDMSDAVLIMQSLSNPSKYKLTEQGRKNADFDGDGVTNGDALTIQKKLLKLD